MFRSFILLFSLVFVTHLLDHALALTGEGIIGGHYGHPLFFKYQAAILGKLNGTTASQLICSGAILSDVLVLSAAQCFISLGAALHELRFMVLAGLNNLARSGGARSDVDKIYVPPFGSPEEFKDIAVVQLTTSLNVSANPFLAAVKLSSLPPVTGDVGRVSGYGFTWVKVGVDLETGRTRRIDGGTEYLLKYALVCIVDTEFCRTGYIDPVYEWQVCATMPVDSAERPYWGVCSKDAGSPLVINNQVVAIASKNRVNCDDTFYGGIYTRIGPFIPFIFSLIAGEPLSDTLVYDNRPHVPTNVTSQ